MGAFFVAGFIFTCTLALSFFVLILDASNDTTGQQGTSAGWVLLAGTIVSALIASSHWWTITW